MKQLLVASTLFLLVPFFAKAAPPVHVSEIAWAGSALSTADEWFELCAAPGTDLSGWTIEGASAAPMTLAPGSVVGDRGAFLVANYGADDEKSTLDASPDLVTTSVALSNSALFIALRDASGAVVDVAGASGTPPFAGTSGAAKTSMERLDGSIDGGTQEAWASASLSIGFDAGATELGTPGSCAAPAESAPPPAEPIPETEVPAEPEAPPERSVPEAPVAAVRISEIYPAPLSGEKEWVELVNRSNTGEFLDGWTVEDAAGTATRLEGLLLPWARYLVIAPKGSLNNDGDTLVLKDARGRTVDSVAYGKVRKGEAVMRIDWQDAFEVTRMPTPGAANVLTAEAAPEPAKPEGPSSSEPVPEESAVVPETRSVIRDLETRGSTENRDPGSRPSGSPGMTSSNGPLPQSARPRIVATSKKSASKPRYKGDAYVATIVTPPGVYAKTRLYVLLDGSVEEVRLSKGVDAWRAGDRIAFIAQKKSEGAVAFLLANPNSIRVTGSASATFAVVDAWPPETGGYRFTADVAAVKGEVLEVAFGGIEGDVLLPAGLASALKPGDTVEIEGFIAPGPRPRVVLPRRDALRLATALLPAADAPPPAKLPWPAAAGLTGAAGTVGLSAYLRQQRLKRLALTQAEIGPEEFS